MRGLVILFSLVFSAIGYCEFNGDYLGDGYTQMLISGKKRRCQKIYLSLVQKTHSLIIKDGGYFCEDMIATYDEVFFELVDNKLYYQDKLVGSINKNKLNLVVFDQSDNSLFNLLLEKTKHKLKYQEMWYQHEVPQMKLEGLLKRQ